MNEEVPQRLNEKQFVVNKSEQKPDLNVGFTI